MTDCPQHHPAHARRPYRAIRRAGPACAAAVGCIVLGLVGGQPASAADNCTGLSPGADGVLRLDTAGGIAWPCGGRNLRAYDAMPEQSDMRAAPPKPEPEHELESGPKPGPAPVQSDNTPAVDRRPANDDVLRLKDETAQLKDEVARLREETSRLRDATVRLNDQLARRDATVSAPTDSKVEEQAPKSAATEPAPKGDLLTTEPQKSEIPKTPIEKKSEAQLLSDQREFERQKTVVERAWSQLLDLAARMKKDLSGKGE
jgi:pyruvate/2-oxoglutarate dehydrogenase complex dihydrolipoamide acyltransferase (E2) component